MELIRCRSPAVEGGLPASSISAPSHPASVTPHRTSNREIQELEFTLSHCKQTSGTSPNRERFRVLHCRLEPRYSPDSAVPAAFLAAIRGTRTGNNRPKIGRDHARI